MSQQETNDRFASLQTQLKLWVHERGYEITPDVQDAVTDLASVMAHSVHVPDKDEDPYRRWQCFTPEANAAMESLFQGLEADLRNGILSRLTLPDAIARRLEKLGDGREAGHMDTEPQYELSHRLNPVLDELGYKSIERWDW